MNEIITKIRQELKQNSDETTRISGQRFFKEKINLYGVKSAEVNKIGKKYFNEIKAINKDELFALCETLWQSNQVEEAIIACNWSYAIHKDFLPDDIKIFEKWVKNYINNWATCDTLCNHTVGTFIEMYPTSITNLKDWAKNENLWMRRASAVSLIIPARKGKFLKDIFEIADKLLLDQEDMVQKGYGWMLKAASQAYQGEVFEYVMSNKQIMPRTALRYAIEKMPKELKAKAMERS